MKIKSAKYVKSCIDYKECPKPDKPEFAFVGRSNVGKSSLINMLVNINNLAHTSSKPGKTQTINHFLINERWYLVDLPGYGYARKGKKQREVFAKMITEYILKRKNLLYVFVLLDARIEPQPIDFDFIYFLGSNQIPQVLVFTKTDKLSNNQLNANLKTFEKKLYEIFEELPPVFLTSAVKKTGRKELLDFIDETINKYWDPKKIIPNLL